MARFVERLFMKRFYKKIYNKIYETIKKAALSGQGVSKLSCAFCIGLYISFSPYPGFHTIMVLASSWLFGLNLPVTFLGACVNNPWTMFPMYSLDYSLGYWLIHNFLGWNAPFAISLGKIFGAGKICLISFFVGGNLIGVLAAIVGYPIAFKVFEKIVAKSK